MPGQDFFFSSRRRHTRCLSDWSSDVCSSDLAFQVVEHDLIASARGDDLPVAPAQRAVGPPAILHQPGLAYRVHLATVDELGNAVMGGSHGDPAREDRKSVV